jgi:arylsulfatase A-like enzyme
VIHSLPRRMMTIVSIIVGLIIVSAQALAAPSLGYNLTDNLPNAHLYESGTVVNLNHMSGVKYLRDMKRRWVYGFKYKGRESALPQSIRADFWLPISTELIGKKLALDVVLAPTGNKQVMDVFVDGKKIKNVNFENQEWQTIRIPVSDKMISKSKNVKVKLHFRRRNEVKNGGKSPAAIRAIRLGLASSTPLPSEESILQRLLMRDVRGQISLATGHGLDYYVSPSAESALFKGQVSGGTLEIWGETDQAKPKKLKEVTGAFNLDLKAFAGKAMRLMLRAPNANLTLSGQIGGFKSATQVKLKKPKYVIFWLIDTLRADKLPFYEVDNSNGRAKVKTPNLEALAKESVLFEPFYVQGNESKASHASLFTGVYPITHRVYTHEAKLPKKYTTIAELFKANGYHTGGYVSNGYVSDRWDFDQGFKTFTNFIRESKANNAKAVVRSAKHFIKKRKAKPFYLYLGTSDPHVTYRRHKEFMKDYFKGSYKGRYMKNITGQELADLKKKGPPSKKDKSRVEALYENEIAFNDFHFGELVKTLKAEGIYDETMIIVSADHGDEFWEHGSCGHGHSLYQELINVPLMIRWPASLSAGRFEAGADGVDLLPTLATLIGAQLKGKIQGRDLSVQRSVTDAYPQAIMASQGIEQFTLKAGPAKVIYRGPGSVESYDLSNDIKEAKNLSESHPILTLTALDPLSLYLAHPRTWSKAKYGAPNALSADFPQEFPKTWRSPKKR